MTERSLSPIAASFRREALEILERRKPGSEKVPARYGRIVLQPLRHGYRLDVMSRTPDGKPQRLATAHFHDVHHARSIAGKLAATMQLRVRDLTQKGAKP